MIKQVHTHPVITNTSSTTERPNRAPRALLAVEMLLFSALLDDDGLDAFGVVQSEEAVGGCGQDKLAVTIWNVVTSLTVVLHWLGVTIEVGITVVVI